MYNNHYLLYRAKVVQELHRAFYECDNRARCRMRLWDYLVKPLEGISYNNYSCYLKVDTSSLDSEGAELISQLIESIREKCQYFSSKSSASFTRDPSMPFQETIWPYSSRKQKDLNGNRNFLYRARVAQELSWAFYERENRCRNHRAIWQKFAKHLLGISYNTYLSYLRVDTSSLNPEATGFIAQLIRSIRDKHRQQYYQRFCYDREQGPITRSHLLSSQKSERIYQTPKQAKLNELGLKPVCEQEMRTDRVYRFYTDGALYDVHDSVIAQVIAKDSESFLWIGPVSTITGFIAASMPLPKKYTLVREATGDEVNRFVRFQCSRMNVDRYRRKVGKKKA